MSQALANLFIIAAPSGAGKSSLINALLQRAEEGHLFNPAQLSVSHTTRQPRDGEVDSEHYHFVSVDTFKQMQSEDAFYESAQVFDNYYGTSKKAIADKLNQGTDVFLDIDWQGARQVKQINPEVISIFILPPSREELHARLVSRGKDSDSVIQSRMEKAKSEMSHYNEFDYVIINDNFTHALDSLINVVKGASLQATKQALRHQHLIESLLQE